MSSQKAISPDHRELSRLRKVWWAFLYTLVWTWMVGVYRYRSWGRRNLPKTGPALLISNHQSFYDPILVGLGTAPQPCFAIARATLFNSAAVRWLINSLNAIPVRQGEGDVAAMRRSIDVLKQGHRLMIFPEGSRTSDGAIHAFQNGTMLLIRRAKVPVIPVAIEGAFDAWPIHQSLPRASGRIGVMYGEPIDCDKLLAMGTEGALQYLTDTVEAMREKIAERIEHPSAK